MLGTKALSSREEGIHVQDGSALDAETQDEVHIQTKVLYTEGGRSMVDRKQGQKYGKMEPFRKERKTSITILEH